MFRSIIAVSEGGPDAVMSFTLARRIAGIFDGTVDAHHLPAARLGGAPGLPVISDTSGARSVPGKARAPTSRSWLPCRGATYIAEAAGASLESLVAMGRFSDILVLGRPGTNAENVAPDTVKTAIHECARAVMIAPTKSAAGPFGSVIVAWNGSFQATRAVEYAMPFLAKASEITILVVGRKPDDVGASYLARNLQRHGLH
jgi:hypothetical protein